LGSGLLEGEEMSKQIMASYSYVYNGIAQSAELRDKIRDSQLKAVKDMVGTEFNGYLITNVEVSTATNMFPEVQIWGREV